MIPPDGGHARVYRWLLRLYPAAFRARFADEMVQLFSDQLREARTGAAPAGTARTWLRTLGDLVITAASEHSRRERTMAHSLAATPPSTSSRVLGLVGILGGAVLLVAFVVDISPELNSVRIYLFLVGAMAIVIGVHRRQASIAPAVALLGAVPALLANAWYLLMMILATGRLHPFAGDFGLVFFAAGVAMSLTDAAFGLVTLRLGVVSRWGALALAIGSILAVTGIDRLELTSTIFGPLSQVGIVLGGIGWILLGLDIATRRRPSEAQPQKVRPGS
ncbi:MAG: hypothetical protein M3R49_01790 [Chloroflexota bacterium]|nr:hypothetical protein [Chloroflexota bacterium]